MSSAKVRSRRRQGRRAGRQNAAPEHRLTKSELEACAQLVQPHWNGRRRHRGPLVLTYATTLPTDWTLGSSAAAQALPLVVAGLGLPSWPWYEGGSQVITGIRRASQVLRRLLGDEQAVIVADAGDTFIPTELRGSANAALQAVLEDQRRVLVGAECWSWPKCYTSLFADDTEFQGCLATSSTCWPNGGTQLATTRALASLYFELARRLAANRRLPPKHASMGKIERTNNQAILVRLFRNRSAMRHDLHMVVDHASTFFASLRPCGPSGANPLHLGAFVQCWDKAFVPGAHLHVNGSLVEFTPGEGPVQPFLLHANGRHGRLYKDRRFRPRLAQLRASRPALYQHPVLLIDAAGRGVCNITTLGKLLDPG